MPMFRLKSDRNFSPSSKSHCSNQYSLLKNWVISCLTST